MTRRERTRRERDCKVRGHHAWTWKHDEGYAQVCDDCGAERVGPLTRWTEHFAALCIEHLPHRAGRET